MRRNGRPVVPEFAPAEDLYRRCHPDAIDTLDDGELRVLSTAFDKGVHALSMQRSAFAQADFVRWDSATDPGNVAGFVPQLWRDWFVVAVRADAVPKTLAPPAGGAEYLFTLRHKPFDDSYAHTEIEVMKGGKLLDKEWQFNNKHVKLIYQTILADKAIVSLKPDQVQP